MGKPIATIQLGVARFQGELLERLSVSRDAALDWVLAFAKALAYQKPELNEYAAECLADVEAFRRAEAERKNRTARPSEDSAGKTRNKPERRGTSRKDADSALHTFSHSATQPSKKPHSLKKVVAELRDLYATERVRHQGTRNEERVGIAFSEEDENTMAAILAARPDYPMRWAILWENNRGGAIREPRNFLARLPAVGDVEALMVREFWKKAKECIRYGHAFPTVPAFLEAQAVAQAKPNFAEAMEKIRREAV